MKINPAMLTFGAAVCVLVIAVGALLLAQRREPVVVEPDQSFSALRPDPGMELLSIPEFTLTAQDGSTITRDILVGELTIMDFFFTNCPFICPPMTANMKRAQDALSDTDVRFLSISVDPEHDTPERLREFAKLHDAELSTWTFATGDRAQVARMLGEGLLLDTPREDRSNTFQASDGSTMANITHPGRFILVGPDLEIIALTNGVDRDQVETFTARVRTAWRELERKRTARE